MKITKAEYCQFSSKGREQLLEDFGSIIGEKIIGNKIIKLYKLYDFYVEVMYNKINNKTAQAEPIKTFNMLLFYNL